MPTSTTGGFRASHLTLLASLWSRERGAKTRRSRDSCDNHTVRTSLDGLDGIGAARETKAFETIHKASNLIMVFFDSARMG